MIAYGLSGYAVFSDVEGRMRGHLRQAVSYDWLVRSLIPENAKNAQGNSAVEAGDIPKDD